MKSRTDVQASFIGVPLQYDLLDKDLNSRYPDLPDRELPWGIAVGAVENAWLEQTTIGGIDWYATFFPAKKLQIPIPKRTPTGRIGWRTVPRPCAVLAVGTNSKSPNAARDFGRPAVRALLALLRREIPPLLPGDVLWEGIIVQVRKNRIGMSAAGTQMEVRQPATPTRIAGSGLGIVKVALQGLPSHVVRALQWLQLARAAQLKADQFLHMWLAVLALTTYGASVGNDVTRIKKYVAQMGTGVGGVVSQKKIQNMIKLLVKAYDVRNQLMHRNNDSGITLELLEELEQTAFELADFELRRAGMTGSTK